MENILNSMKSTINTQVSAGKVSNSGVAFSKYQKTYFSTNENLKDYVGLVDSDANSVLTVLASGDHLFNLLSTGVVNVDTFDTNVITEYLVYGLKYAMIQKYNYDNYIKCLKILVDKNTSLDEMTSILISLLPYMDNKYRKLWKEVIDYNYKIQKENNTNLNIIYLLFINISEVDNIVFSNKYLSNKKEYNKLKNVISKANISFKNIDAINVPEHYKHSYDAILFSNIFDYMYKHFGYNFNILVARDYIDKLVSMLNEDGLLFLNYIFKYSSINYERSNVISNSNIKLTDVEDGKILVINGSNQNQKIVRDGVLILKKR